MKEELNNKDTHKIAPDSFEPWEQTYPIPLSYLVIAAGLILFGVLYYVNSHYPDRVINYTDQTSLVKDYKEASLPPAPTIVSEGNEVVWSCASCHGLDGLGNGQTPVLAGLNETYLAKQLKDFKERTRDNGSMIYVVDNISDEELAESIEYYASLERKAKIITNIGGSVERGRMIAEEGIPGVPQCSTCHSEKTLMIPIYPNIISQRPDYLYSQLEAFQGGNRKNDPIMPTNVKNLTSEDMRDVAQYYHELRLSTDQ